MKVDIAPVCIFAYNREDTLRITVESLKENFLASQVNLYIYSDGAKTEKGEAAVNKVRDYIKTIEGFKSITIKESPVNKGLAKSVIDGVTEVINIYGKIVVLEDDLVLSKNFLNYINQALDFYYKNSEIFSVTGYTKPVEKPDGDIYFTKRASSLGWATWSEVWNTVDWEVKNYETLVNSPQMKRDFKKMGSDMVKMLTDQMTGKINSWAIRWCFDQFLKGTYTVYPTVSKVLHIGNDSRASNAHGSRDRFYTVLDESDRTDFDFSKKIQLEKHYIKQFLKHYSLSTRIKYKFLSFLE